MTEHGEDTPAPTCSLQSDKCSFMYGSHRCTLRAGHEALGLPHQVVLRFAPSARSTDAEDYGLPTPALPARCECCEHMLTTGCEVWSEAAKDGGICRTFSVRR
jgi:hypothetical protein